jgi:hypothetical protein
VAERRSLGSFVGALPADPVRRFDPARRYGGRQVADDGADHALEHPALDATLGAGRA